ncbi:late embryogenesis abundant protein [Zea mays]|uniref:Late embryogenesis abundant protein n=1 Tax=Zea mays TaxID=4577 RepID=A0A1D6F653_MAIZE|nr:late embryogenesis abundant protein [Zea mays]
MVLAVVVLLDVVVVLVVVLLQPRTPYVAVRAASLYVLVYGQTGALDDVQVTVLPVLRACQGRPPAGVRGARAGRPAGRRRQRRHGGRAPRRRGAVPGGGEAQTRWKVAGIVGVDQWTRLACQLRFFWPNGTVLPFRCSSKSKLLFF